MRAFILFFGNRIIEAFDSKFSAEMEKAKCVMETFLNRDDFGQVLLDDTMTFQTSDNGENYWITEIDIIPGEDGEVADSFDEFSKSCFPELYARFSIKRTASVAEKRKRQEELQASETNFKQYLRSQEKVKAFEIRRKNLDTLLLQGGAAPFGICARS